MTEGRRILETYELDAGIERLSSFELSGHKLTKEYLGRRRPVIVTGLTNNWPACTNWTLDSLCQRFANIYTNVFDNGNEGSAVQQRFKRFHERIQAGEKLYSSLYLKELLSVVKNEYPLDHLLLGDQDFNWLLELDNSVHGEMNVLFFGCQGVGVKNHLDSMGTHLWSAQIEGRKRWIIYPPEQGEFLADGEANWLAREQSVKTYPDFVQAEPLDFVLESTEVLFLPVGWWHQTLTLTPSVSITHDIVNASNFFDYRAELKRSSDDDPKIARFAEASAPLLGKWAMRMPHKSPRVVERRRGLSFDELLNEYLVPHRPVILTDQLDTLPAMKRWSFEYFREYFNNAYIQVFLKRDDEAEFTRIARFLGDNMSPPHYAMWCLDDFVTTSLGEDIERLPILSGADADWSTELPIAEQRAMTWIFMGRRGAGIGNHTDRLGQHVASAQITGRKRWLLHPPEDTGWLHEGDVDLINPDFDHFPRYAQAPAAFEFVLEPGEVFILPFGWWHQTVVLEDSISLSHDFVNRSNASSFIEFLGVRKGPEYMDKPEIKRLLDDWHDRVEVAC